MVLLPGAGRDDGEQRQQEDRSADDIHDADAAEFPACHSGQWRVAGFVYLHREVSQTWDLVLNGVVPARVSLTITSARPVQN